MEKLSSKILYLVFAIIGAITIWHLGKNSGSKISSEPIKNTVASDPIVQNVTVEEAVEV